MEPEPIDEIQEIEEGGPEAGSALANVEASPELLPLHSTEISFQTLKAISGTELIPAGYRDRPYLILAAVLTGKEYGLGPMASLSHIVIVDGRASISAELATRLIREAGHRIEIVEHSDRICTLRGVRTDTGDEMTVSFSIEDAARAGLVSIEDGTPRARSRKGRPLPWETYTDDLLWARAITRLHKRLFADLPAGVGPEQPIEGEGGSDL